MKKWIGTYVLLAVSCLCSAQNLHTISQTNLSGIYAPLANPANAVGGIHRASFSALGVGVSLRNNALRSYLDYELIRFGDYGPWRMEVGSLDSATFTLPRSYVKNPRINAQVDVLQIGGLLAINKKVSLYAFARERAFVNVDNTSYETLKFLNQNSESHTSPVGSLSLNARTLAYQELVIGMAWQMYEHRSHYWKMGLSVKRLNGRSLYMVEVPRVDATLGVEGVRVSGELNIWETAMDLATQNPTQFLLKPAMGAGAAADIGIVYEHRPKHLKTTFKRNNLKKRTKFFAQKDRVLYDYKLGFSLHEIGAIRFSKEVLQHKHTRIQSQFDTSDLGDLTLESYTEELIQDGKTSITNQSRQFRLPSLACISYDQRLYNGWFLMASYRQNLLKPNGLSFYQPTDVYFQVRQERSIVVYGFTAYAVPSTRTYTLGAYGQVGPFFMGTDNLGTLFFRKMYNPSFYLGVFHSIRYKKDPTIENHRSFRTKNRRWYDWTEM